MKRVTITDVATVAGVSVATVSRVLADSPLVTEEKKRLVLEAVQKLDYQPNSVARTLKMRKSDTIGLLVPDISNPFFAELARGAEDLAHSAGYSVMLCNYDSDLAKERRYLEVLVQKQVDGIVYAGSGMLGGTITNLLRSGMPIVCFDRDVEGFFNVDTVSVDDVAGAELAVGYLLSLGHRRIVLLMGPSHLNSSKGRLTGYKIAIARHGVKYDSRLVLSGGFSFNSGYSLAKELLNLKLDFTAVFAMSDMMAIGCIKAFEEAGLAVPGDISVIGFDNISLSGLVKPALTTIAQPVYELGSKAMDLLLDNIGADGHEPQSVLLDTELVIRQSCRRLA